MKSRKSPAGTIKATVLFIVVTFIIALLLSTGCGKSPGQLPVIYGESDLERMGLGGRVKSLTLFELNWEEAFGKISITSLPEIDQSTSFLKTGNQIESIYYNAKGQPSRKDNFIYDTDDETWLECISYKYNNETEATVLPQWSYINTYDETGRLYRVDGYDYDEAGHKLAGISWVHLYTYLDDEGKLVQSSYSSNGTLQWKNVTEYNSRRLEVKSTHYNSLGEMQWNDRFKYDTTGKKTEWSRYDSDGSMTWKDTFQYDDNGNETVCLNYDYRGQLMWKQRYLYINEGDLEGLDLTDTSKIASKFDSSGNWTIKITLEEKEGFGGTFTTVKEIQKRTLVYFP